MKIPGGLGTQHATVVRKNGGMRELRGYNKSEGHTEGLCDVTSYEIRFQHTHLGEHTHAISSSHV